MEDDQVLLRPTVGELIKALSKYDADSKVVIEDADTFYLIVIIHIQSFGDEVTLFGKYEEMTK